mgnify:CR=1 FL=1
MASDHQRIWRSVRYGTDCVKRACRQLVRLAPHTERMTRSASGSDGAAVERNSRFQKKCRSIERSALAVCLLPLRSGSLEQAEQRPYADNGTRITRIEGKRLTELIPEKSGDGTGDQHGDTTDQIGDPVGCATQVRRAASLPQHRSCSASRHSISVRHSSELTSRTSSTAACLSRKSYEIGPDKLQVLQCSQREDANGR